MNNRYIFRGKRKDNGEWVYGNLIFRRIWSSEFYVIRVEDNGFDNYEEYEVIPETVCRCTELKDKNGKLIFTGDVVKVCAPKYSGIYKVVWCETIATVQLTRHANKCLTVVDFGGLWETGDYTCEVIGNIHDNKDLLEVQE